MTVRRRRRRKKLLDDFKEERGYCKLKEEALDRTLWRNRFERDHGPVVRQTTKRMNLQYPCLMSGSTINLLLYDNRAIG